MKRLLPRFGLRLVLVVMTMAAVAFAIWGQVVEPYRQQAAALERLSQLDGFDAGNADAFSLEDTRFYVPTELDWQGKLVGLTLGKNKYMKMEFVRFPRGTTEEDITYVLSRSRYLRSVSLERSELSRRTLACLASLRELVELSLIHI